MLARSDDSLKTAKDILDSRNSHLSNVYSFISTLLVEISDIIGIDQDIESLDSLVFKCILDFHDSNSSQSEYSSLVVFDKIKNGILNLVKETSIHSINSRIYRFFTKSRRKITL